MRVSVNKVVFNSTIKNFKKNLIYNLKSFNDIQNVIEIKLFDKSLTYPYRLGYSYIDIEKHSWILDIILKNINISDEIAFDILIKFNKCVKSPTNNNLLKLACKNSFFATELIKRNLLIYNKHEDIYYGSIVGILKNQDLTYDLFYNQGLIKQSGVYKIFIEKIISNSNKHQLFTLLKNEIITNESSYFDQIIKILINEDDMLSILLSKNIITRKSKYYKTIKKSSQI